MVQSEQLGTIVSLLDNAPIYLVRCVIQKRKNHIILSQILSSADNFRLLSIYIYFSIGHSLGPIVVSLHNEMLKCMSKEKIQ